MFCACIYNVIERERKKSTRLFSHYTYFILPPPLSWMCNRWRLKAAAAAEEKKQTSDLFIFFCFDESSQLRVATKKKRERNILFITFVEIEAYSYAFLYLWEVGRWKKRKNGICLEGFVLHREIYIYIYIFFFVLFYPEIRRRSTLSLSLSHHSLVSISSFLVS